MRRRTFLSVLAGLVVAPVAFGRAVVRRKNGYSVAGINPCSPARWRNYTYKFVYEPRFTALARIRKEYGLSVAQCREIARDPLEWEFKRKLERIIRETAFTPPLKEMT